MNLVLECEALLRYNWVIPKLILSLEAGYLGGSFYDFCQSFQEHAYSRSLPKPSKRLIHSVTDTVGRMLVNNVITRNFFLQSCFIFI
jgi:hypothetical protein